MPSNDDVFAIDYVNKTLTVGFIVGIFAANCALIYRTVRKGGFFYTPKSLTLISLAIGDIFLALFPLVVNAIMLFEASRGVNISCSTYVSHFLYLYFFIHFVYGTGLIVLAVELVHRYRNQSSPGQTKINIVKSFVCSAFPWILGLVVILPLMLAGSHMSSCLGQLTMQRLKATYGVSVILPAGAAVIMCIIVMCIRFLPAYYTSPAVADQVTEQATFLHPQNTYIISQQHTGNNPVGATQYPMGNAVVVHEFPLGNAGPQQYPSNSVPDNNKHDPNFPGLAFSAPITQYPGPQYPVQQQVQPQYSTQQHPQFPVQQYITQPNVVIAAPIDPLHPQSKLGSVLPDPGREKKALLIVSVIHFLCVVPHAVYVLGSNINGYTPGYIDTILNLVLFWLFVFRSLVTPCIFAILNK